MDAGSITSARLLDETLDQSRPNTSRSDRYSIFTDAAWNPSSGCGGLAWIVDDRVFSSQHSATTTFISWPLMAEVLAVQAAINFALTRDIDSVNILSY